MAGGLGSMGNNVSVLVSQTTTLMRTETPQQQF